MRRTVPAVALALLLVLAGCNLPPNSGPAGPSPTPALDEVERPPGVNNGRLADGKALLKAHNRTVIEEGFESDFRVNGTTTFSGSVVELRRRQQTVVESGAVEYQYYTANGGEAPRARFDYWGNRTTVAIRAQSANTTQYDTGEPPSPQVLSNVQTLAYMMAINFSVTSVDRTNGTVLFTLRGEKDELDAGQFPWSKFFPKNATNATNYRAALVVDREGRIHEFVATADYTIDGEPGSMEIRYQLLRAGGIEVDRPDWVSEALRSDG